MLKILADFAACLRAYDLGVSTSEVLDCAQSLCLVDGLDPAVFRTVARSHFVKSRRDFHRFDQVFDLYFQARPFAGPPAEDKEPSPGKHGTEHRLFKALAAENDPSGTVSDILSFLKGDPLNFLSRMHRLHTRPETQPVHFKSNLGQLSAKLEVMLHLDRVRRRVEDFLNSPGGGPGEQGGNGAAQRVMERLERARQLLEQEPVTANKAIVRGHENPDPANAGDIPFSNLTGPELHRIQQLTERLVRKLKDKADRRYRTRNRGQIDIKKTLRRSGKFQGVPLDIIYKKKPPQKGRIIALCDVSGSVWSTARFMLQLLYSLQDCFSNVRSFAFVSALAEITAYFSRDDIDTAVAGALSRAPLNLGDRTDYGAVFQAFAADHLDSLTPRTTLILLGDGRSNYFNPQAHILGKLRNRCKRIIWLTPEPVHLWSQGDCEINTYAAHCHEVRTCMNLNHLSEFVTELVL